MITVSAPSGTGAPVKIRAAVPASSGSGATPAGIRWETLSLAPSPGASEARRAYPSIALLSHAGTLMRLITGSASTLPRASLRGTSSNSATGLAWVNSKSSASSYGLRSEMVGVQEQASGIFYFSSNRGTSTAKLQGRVRISSCGSRIFSQAVRQAPLEPGTQKIKVPFASPATVRDCMVEVPISS